MLAFVPLYYRAKPEFAERRPASIQAATRALSAKALEGMDPRANGGSIIVTPG